MSIKAVNTNVLIWLPSLLLIVTHSCPNHSTYFTYKFTLNFTSSMWNKRRKKKTKTTKSSNACVHATQRCTSCCWIVLFINIYNFFLLFDSVGSKNLWVLCSFARPKKKNRKISANKKLHSTWNALINQSWLLFIA